jgi:phosphoribosylanthranilate isomerase
VRIKVCCISTVAEAELGVARGADALGLVSHMPSGPGVIEEALITEIAAAVPPPIATFLLTSHDEVDAIIAQQRRCRTNTLQLVDALPTGSHAKLRRALPGVSLVQVIHVRDEAAIDEAQSVAPDVDTILLDSGNPDLATKELGGTGRVHNWEISRRIVEKVAVPVFLAGGLNPENITEALTAVRPFGVDICSGLRTDDALDDVKLTSFVRAVHTTSETS